MNRSVIYSLILILNLLVAPSVYSWQLPLEVAVSYENGEKMRSKLVAGIEKEATDGYDNLWDTPALITTPDPDAPVTLRAYFSRELQKDVNPVIVSGNKYLWKDIRGPARSGDTVWYITLDSIPEGKNVVLSWAAPQGLLKANEKLVLKDSGVAGPDGHPVVTDVIEASSYEFVSDGQDSRYLSLVLSTVQANSRGGSGSGFGCGTIKSGSDNKFHPEADALITLILLFSPLFFRRLRLLRSASRR